MRSQPMTLIQLVIPFDVAHDTVDELGRLGVVQFKDVSISLYVQIFLRYSLLRI